MKTSSKLAYLTLVATLMLAGALATNTAKALAEDTATPSSDEPIVIENDPDAAPPPGNYVTEDLVAQPPPEEDFYPAEIPIRVRFWKEGEKYCAIGRRGNAIVAGIYGETGSQYLIDPKDGSLFYPETRVPEDGLTGFQKANCLANMPADMKELFSDKVYSKFIGLTN